MSTSQPPTNATTIAGTGVTTSGATTAGRRRVLSLGVVLATTAATLALLTVSPSLVAHADAPVANAYVYWTNTNNAGIDSIGRADVDGSDPDQSFISLPDQSCGYGVLATAYHVYWASGCTGKIGRADLDSSNAVTNVDPDFITGIGPPGGIAIDDEHIYWASGSDSNPSTPDNAIGRADLDGDNVEKVFIASSAQLNALEVAVDENYIYWTNNSNVVGAGSIGRADLTGNNVDQDFIPGASSPAGIVLDSQYIYWANNRAGTIGRADLDGSDPDQGFIPGANAPGFSGPIGVAVDASHVYWTNPASGAPGTGQIRRADLDGMNVDPTFVTGANTPRGVSVYNPANLPPGVAVNSAAAQPDPTSDEPILFDVEFSEPVTGFTSADVALGGTAGATTAVVSGGPSLYSVGVSGMTQSGTVTASVPAQVAQDSGGAGNTASVSTDNVVQWNLPDTTPPVVTCSTPAPVFLLKAASAQVTGTLVDETDPTTPQPLFAPADTSTVGPKSVTLSGQDAAGNTGSAQCGYTVAYGFAGFFAPVDNPPVVNTANAGQTIPFKFTVTNATGAPVTTLTTAIAQAVAYTCRTGVIKDAIETYATGKTELKNLGKGRYQFNFKTLKAWAGSCRTLGIDLGDGVDHTADFQFK